MSNLRTALASAAIVGATCVGAVVAADPSNMTADPVTAVLSAHAAPRPHKACQTEDSSWCVWDARHMGNGSGRSFWTGHAGRVHYVSHAVAHAMVTR